MAKVVKDNTVLTANGFLDYLKYMGRNTTIVTATGYIIIKNGQVYVFNYDNVGEVAAAHETSI